MGYDIGTALTRFGAAHQHSMHRSPKIWGTPSEIPTTGPESEDLSKALKRKGFRFVGPTTMYALMEAIGMVDTHLLDSHRRGASGVWAE